MNRPPAKQHIIALAGGGFFMEPDNPLLDDWLLGRIARPASEVRRPGRREWFNRTAPPGQLAGRGTPQKRPAAV